MATEVKIPIPDQTTEEVRIVKWNKAPGDTVAKGEVVLEVETDKSVIEVEATAQGVLIGQMAGENDMVPVGEIVAYVGQAGESVPTGKAQAVPQQASPAPAETPTAAPAGELPADVTPVKVPVPDQTTEEVRIVKWAKALGDAVAKGEVVLEVETDKSVIEVESAAAGVLLKQLAGENDMVPVGEIIAYVGPEGTEIAATAAQQTTAPAAAPAATASPSVATDDQGGNGRVKASPLARQVAGKLGVALSQVTGTGPNGRITRADVEAHAQAGPATALATGADVAARGEYGRILASPRARRLAQDAGVNLAAIAGTGLNGRIIGADVATFVAQKPAAAPAPGQPVPGTEVAVTKMRRAIGLNLQSSARDVPHFNVTMSIDMSRAMRKRGELNEGREKPQRVSVNDLVVKACAVALKQYPAVNSRFTEEKITYLPDVNVGVATAVPDGLVVPVLTNANERDWYDLAGETKRLATSARQGKIIGAGKGTFTVSNLGMYGVDNFTAIINPPESAILAVGAVQDQVVVIDGNIGIRPMMKATLCSDHRVVDGALAAEFLRAVRLYLEEQI